MYTDGRLLKPPRLQVFSTCTNLIRTLPALPYDTIRVEDVDTDAEDHAYDALRYGLGVERRTAGRPDGPIPIEVRSGAEPREEPGQPQMSDRRRKALADQARKASGVRPFPRVRA